MNSISIIIPTNNEEDIIANAIAHLRSNGGGAIAEIIVVDALSTDNTRELAIAEGAHVIESSQKNRAFQMNLAAKHAKSEILYFVHADCLPPKSYVTDIFQSFKEGFEMGCYRSKLDSNHPLLMFNSWMTRFRYLYFRGGDQTFFIKSRLFEILGGYNESFCIMEEYDFIRRHWKNHPFKIIPKSVLISIRKYDGKSYWKVNYANLKAVRAFKKGIPPEEIKQKYLKLLK